MTNSSVVDEAWRSHHAYLVNLAYQMLGDVGEAEDVAQEAFLRLSRTSVGDIDDIRGWLTVVAGRLCLDLLRSARVRRERPQDVESIESRQPREPDPADRVTLDDEVRGAMLRLLQRLSPGERVSFVLHDVFQMPFDEIAEALGRPVGTCRQLARRARGKFATAAPRLNRIADSEHQLVTQTFITACANGDFEALTAVLDPAVWGVGTVIGDGTPPPQINHGPDEVGRNLLRYLGHGATLVNGPLGEPVLLAYAERRLFAVIVLTINDNLVCKIEASVDPTAAARSQ